MLENWRGRFLSTASVVPAQPIGCKGRAGREMEWFATFCRHLKVGCAPEDCVVLTMDQDGTIVRQIRARWNFVRLCALIAAQQGDQQGVIDCIGAARIGSAQRR